MEHSTNQLGDNTPGKQPKAFELIELFYERIYGFLRRLTANDADAADLTQRTFSKVWQKLPTFAGRSSPSSWIHSIAYHLYVDWRRSDRRTEVRPDAWWAACPAPESAPDGNRRALDLTGRSVRILEPDGSCQLYLYTNAAPGVASSYSSTEVPITAAFTNTFDNSALDQRNTFHWNRQQ